MFRVVGLHATGHEGWNSCFTDFSAPAALGRLIQGEVQSIDDLRAAELALQALMWHERVDVLVPAFKNHHGNLVGYARETDPRTQIAFDLFNAASAYDQLFLVEDVHVHDGTVKLSSINGSGIRGLSFEEAKATYLHRSAFQAAVLSPSRSTLEYRRTSHTLYCDRIPESEGSSGSSIRRSPEIGTLL